MTPFHLSLFLSLSPSLVSGMELVSVSPVPGTVTPEGSPLTLSCSSSSPWFFCLWHSPVGDKECAIQESEVTSVCGEEGDLRTLHTQSHSSTCQLELHQVTREDHGHWMCLLNDIQEFDTVKRKVMVEVGVKASTSWGSVPGLEGEVLSLVEGQHRELVCQGGGGYPAPTFIWEAHHRDTKNRHIGDRAIKVQKGLQRNSYQSAEEEPIPLNKTSQVSLVQSGKHLYYGHQSLSYTARVEDSGTNITCTVIQLNQFGEALYTSSISLRLEVAELVIYSQGIGVLEESIGIITGIILAVIFIILIFILIAVLLTRRRKKVSKYASLNGDKSKDELLTPIWKSGKKTKVLCLVSSPGEYSSTYLECGESLSGSGPGGVGTNGAMPTGPKDQAECHTQCHVHTQQGRDNCYQQENMIAPPRDVLDTSLDSEESSTEHSVIGGHSLSRPTTRTTKTISSASNSSHSSIETDRSGRERGGGEDTLDHYPEETLSMGRQAGAISPSFHPSHSQDPEWPRNDTSTPSRLHETHFGSSIGSIPLTVLHNPLHPEREGKEKGRGRLDPPLSSDRSYFATGEDEGGPQIFLPHDQTHFIDPLPRVRFGPGDTIFDCELGCFVTIEEYQRRRSNESLNSGEDKTKTKTNL